MNFFKSVFTDDDPDPEPETHQPATPDDPGSGPHHPDPNPTSPSAKWSFGGLMKTLQVKSDWIETYRRDLEEFGSGLRRETEVLKEVASKAVKDLPTNLEIGASKAQTVLKSTAEIISQGKEALLNDGDSSSDASEFSGINNDSNNNSNNVNVQSGYSRFEAQLRALQCDVRTYVEEVEDVDDYGKWRNGFDLEGKSDEIEGLLRENGGVGGVYRRVVPNDVDHEVFWCRYYYRVYRLERAENVRAKLVKRAISTEDEEELSWDVDDEEEEEDEEKVDGSSASVSSANQMEDKNGNVVEKSVEQEERVSENVADEEKSEVVESTSVETLNNQVQSEGKDIDLSKKAEEKVVRAEPSETGKDSDVSVVSTQPSHEEDDMGWDEIEDVGSEDESKVAQSGSPDRVELRKRLSATVDEDEDLSWDIEDDDEPVKK